jgi:hypothetical protein
MKITRTTEVQPAVASRQEARGRAAQPRAEEAPTHATLSPDASFVRSVREEAAVTADLRPDKVAEAKALVQGGGLEQAVDWDKLLDSLMADL